MREQQRQGDLLFIPVKSVPDEAEKQDHGVIAEGEMSGHKHRLSDSAKAVLMLAAGVAYVRALREVQVLHEEHKPTVLPEGDWEVRRQDTYEPSGWRRVED